jgi:Uri superfamily endonuclease
MTGTTLSLPAVSILGRQGQRGSYILRMQVREALYLNFGKFKGGKVIAVPQGECLYVGSALGRGAMGLARRLIRHATRTGSRQPHPIRVAILEAFATGEQEANALLPKHGKRLHWNVDHLLDQAQVDLTHIIAIRSPLRLEARLGRLLEQDPHTHILEKGLGANDVPGNTHLLAVRAPEAWWTALPEQVSRLLAEPQPK